MGGGGGWCLCIVCNIFLVNKGVIDHENCLLQMASSDSSFSWKETNYDTLF